MTARDAGPLSGLRVLEVATHYAAPQISAMLGDLGADVVKIETSSGDPMRRSGVIHDGVARGWQWIGRNKRSVVLDLETESDAAAFRQLVGVADLLVENLDDKTRARWHCTYEELAAHNERLVVVRVSGYGTSGPYAGRPGAGTLAEAFAGLAHMTGDPDGPPMLSSVPLGDTVTAFWGVIGALAACWGRDAGSGAGRLVDVAMYEPVLQVLAGTIAAYDPGADPPSRTGSRVPGGAPRNVYRTRDGEWIAVSGTTDQQVERLLPLIAHDTAEDRAQFGTSARRLETGDALDALVATWVASRDRAEAVQALLDARIPVAPVNDIPALLADPHAIARGDIERIRTARAPELGAHRDEVLHDWLAASPPSTLSGSSPGP